MEIRCNRARTPHKLYESPSAACGTAEVLRRCRARRSRRQRRLPPSRRRSGSPRPCGERNSESVVSVATAGYCCTSQTIICSGQAPAGGLLADRILITDRILIRVRRYLPHRDRSRRSRDFSFFGNVFVYANFDDGADNVPLVIRKTFRCANPTARDTGDRLRLTRWTAVLATKSPPNVAG